MRGKRLRFMRITLSVAILALAASLIWSHRRSGAGTAPAQSQIHPPIQSIDPPEDGFYTKVLSFHGILIKAPSVVTDEAMYIAYDRMATETAHLPMVITNLAAAGAQLHIIGRDQVTTDLPEWRQDKHVPLDEYNGLTRDQRTRGMGGLITSCGEENLLKLPTDRYRGRDICMHEFAHNIEGAGIPREVRAKFDAQYQISKSKGLWLNSYAGSNPSEYFAELTMWYFGTHGDMNMTGPKPEDGPEGLKKYDPDAYKLLDDFFTGHFEIAQVEPRFPPGTFNASRRVPRDSLAARALVAHLASYKVGETKLSDFFTDAGMATANDEGTNGWHITGLGPTNSSGSYQFRVFFRKPDAAASQQGVAASPPTQPLQGTNPAQGTNPVAPPPRPTVDRLIADLEFKSGVLSSFKWDN